MCVWYPIKSIAFCLLNERRMLSPIIILDVIQKFQVNLGLKLRSF